MNSTKEKILPEDVYAEKPLVEVSAEIFNLLQFKKQEKQIEFIWRKFRENNLEIILIKGLAAARNYTNPSERRLGDIDLAIKPEKYEAGLRVIRENNLQNVDLHKGLRHLDSKNWRALFTDSQTFECGDELIRIPCPEDHLRILCVHWLNDGGINKEKLWDIFYAVENRPQNFDWDKFLSAVSAKRQKWLICAIGLASKYLGLNLEKTPLADAVRNLPSWLTKAVEAEWKSETKFGYLRDSLNDRKEFFRQLKKRFPPNPVQATIEMEGYFDNKPRIIYQFPNMAKRLIAFVKAVLQKNFGRQN